MSGANDSSAGLGQIPVLFLSIKHRNLRALVQSYPGDFGGAICKLCYGARSHKRPAAPESSEDENEVRDLDVLIDQWEAREKDAEDKKIPGLPFLRVRRRGVAGLFLTACGPVQ
jgi:hypothetical protein